MREAGGHVIAGRVGGTLAVARALGDHALKGPNGGVIAAPSCATREFAKDDRYVLLASDGLWDVVSEGQAQALVLAAEEGGKTPSEIAHALVQAALRQGTRDNVSALLLRV